MIDRSRIINEACWAYFDRLLRMEADIEMVVDEQDMSQAYVSYSLVNLGRLYFYTGR